MVFSKKFRFSIWTTAIITVAVSALIIKSVIIFYDYDLYAKENLFSPNTSIFNVDDKSISFSDLVCLFLNKNLYG